MRTLGDHGTVLIEALAALVLVALAGVMLAVAAAASLRAAHQAALIERAVLIAARHLAALQVRGAPESAGESVWAEPVLGVGATTTTTIHRDPGGIAELAVTVAVPGLRQPIALQTHVLTPE